MEWHEIARSQAGVIERGQLVRCGVTDARIKGLLRRRELIQVAPGVFTARSTPATIGQAEWAAVLWSGGVLSHASAARRWHVQCGLASGRHVTVGDRRFRGTLPGIRVHRVRLDRAEVTAAVGIPVTSRERTVVDLLRTTPFHAARDLCDRGLQQRWICEQSIRRSIAAQPGRTGNRQLRRLLDQLEAGAQAESERLFHRLLRSAGLRGWVAQYRVRTEGRTAYIDVAFPEARLAIEIDGRRAHDELSDRFEDDRVRQNALVQVGWRVLRFTWKQLVDNPDWVIAQIVQLLGS